MKRTDGKRVLPGFFLTVKILRPGGARSGCKRLDARGAPGYGAPRFMKTLYYDCFAGISGDMNLGALVDAGADPAELERRLRTLGVGGWRLEFSREARLGIFGTRARVVLDSEGGADCAGSGGHFHGHSGGGAHAHSEGHSGGHTHSHTHAHRPFSEIKALIENSGLSGRAKADSLKIFTVLAEAEAKIHGREIGEVCFHEVGAVDSIIDIVGAAVCFELLGVDRIVSSAVELGSGTVRCAHGLMPVPAPATAELARRFPSRIGGAPHEAATPTGAAILAAMCSEFEPKISGTAVASGIGIGGRDVPGIANVLRVMVYESGGISGLNSGEMVLLCANIDDMPAEALADLADALMSAGARDAWQEPIVMKKGRLGAKVCALCDPARAGEVEPVFFARSSTLGVRKSRILRDSLPRGEETFNSSFGPVRIKTARFGGLKKSKPEADDVAKISGKFSIPFDAVSRKILDEFERKSSD